MLAADRDLGPDDPMPIEYLAAFKGLWLDRGVQAAIAKGHEYALHDNLT